MTNVGEIFVPILGYEGLYEVSNQGNVKTLAKVMDMPHGHGVKVFPEKLMLLSKSKRHGYLRIKLSNNGKCKMIPVHRLVAMAFIPNPQNKATVNHKDGNKKNNRVENLEWATTQENTHHAKINGLTCSGERHRLSKKVIDIKTGMVFHSAKEASLYYGINHYTLCDRLNGRSKIETTLKYMVDDSK
jgi:hypothetical protein